MEVRKDLRCLEWREREADKWKDGGKKGLDEVQDREGCKINGIEGVREGGTQEGRKGK